MNYKVSFQEMVKLGTEALSRQSPRTLQEKRTQYLRLKEKSVVEKK